MPLVPLARPQPARPALFPPLPFSQLYLTANACSRRDENYQLTAWEKTRGGNSSCERAPAPWGNPIPSHPASQPQPFSPRGPGGICPADVWDSPEGEKAKQGPGAERETLTRGLSWRAGAIFTRLGLGQRLHFFFFLSPRRSYPAWHPPRARHAGLPAAASGSFSRPSQVPCPF